MSKLQSPLLAEEGTTPHSTFLQFINTFYERRYSCHFQGADFGSEVPCAFASVTVIDVTMFASPCWVMNGCK